MTEEEDAKLTDLENRLYVKVFLALKNSVYRDRGREGMKAFLAIIQGMDLFWPYQRWEFDRDLVTFLVARDLAGIKPGRTTLKC